MNFQENTLALICGGGPAPGINNVIASVTIEARNNGWDVLGICDGFSSLATANKKVIPLTIDKVSRIHKEGGSIIRTSRFNPTKSEATMRTVVENLVDLGVTHIVTIGGDDTAYAAYKVSEFARERLGLNIHFVHVPKTIDNDLPLPEGLPTFGFETARALGAELVMNLMEDAKTMGRWFLVVTMGRSSGHLALGIGKSASATLTIIPEEFESETISLHHVIDIMSGAIIKRLALEKDHGLIVAAEGLISKISSQELAAIDCIEKDDFGHVRYAEINFSDVLKKQLNCELKKMGIYISVQNKEIGYEVRCAPPNPFDVEYTRNLGYGAFKFLAEGGLQRCNCHPKQRAQSHQFRGHRGSRDGQDEDKARRYRLFAVSHRKKIHDTLGAARLGIGIPFKQDVAHRQHDAAAVRRKVRICGGAVIRR